MFVYVLHIKVTRDCTFLSQGQGCLCYILFIQTIQHNVNSFLPQPTTE